MVECKIELTFVKLGAAYYGICSARPPDTNNIPPFERLGGLASARQLCCGVVLIRGASVCSTTNSNFLSLGLFHNNNFSDCEARVALFMQYVYDNIIKKATVMFTSLFSDFNEVWT